MVGTILNLIIWGSTAGIGVVLFLMVIGLWSKAVERSAVRLIYREAETTVNSFK